MILPSNYRFDEGKSLFLPLEGTKMEKWEFVRANFSTYMDERAWRSYFSLLISPIQFVYGIFEMLAGIATWNNARFEEGGRNAVRGLFRAIPIIGVIILFLHDRYGSSYLKKIENFSRIIEQLDTYNEYSLQKSRVANI